MKLIQKSVNCFEKERIYIQLNLQHFAGDEKTEKATPKKRSEARKKGQVLQSREITSVLVLIVVFVGIKVFGGYMYSELSAYVSRALTEYPKMQDFASNGVLVKLFYEALIVLLKTTGPLLAMALVVGLIVNYAQVGFLFTTQTLGVKLERINPLSGFKRLFSAHSAVELIKSIIKIVIVSYITYSYLAAEADNVLSIMDLDLMNIAVYIGTISLNVAIRMCIALIFLGVLDYFYQWWEYEKNLKMTKQEVKEEYKQVEGNPEIKSKIKQKQRQISMRRMLQDVPKADVVITNPTHFAIAVKYDTGKADAPVVLAKGQDFIALRIKEVAKENNVEIVENKPLARTLYETVEIGQAIPPELYQAVAEVLAFVYSLKGKGKAV